MQSNQMNECLRFCKMPTYKQKAMQMKDVSKVCLKLPFLYLVYVLFNKDL